jgi:hypothetical protein
VGDAAGAASTEAELLLAAPAPCCCDGVAISLAITTLAPDGRAGRAVAAGPTPSWETNISKFIVEAEKKAIGRRAVNTVITQREGTNGIRYASALQEIATLLDIREHCIAFCMRNQKCRKRSSRQERARRLKRNLLPSKLMCRGETTSPSRGWVHC